jgi:type IV secretory pathway TrbD component
MSELRFTPVYRVLWRPNLFMGGERELVLVTAIVCAGVAVSALNVVAAAVGLGVWLSLIGLFRTMAKADPQMSRVYLRQLQYKLYYAARSRAARDR